MLVLSSFFISFSPGPLLLGWCPHLGWVFLPQLPQSGKSLIDMLRGCLLGESRSSQQINKLTITGDTYKYLGLRGKVSELICVGHSFLPLYGIPLSMCFTAYISVLL